MSVEDYMNLKNHSIQIVNELGTQVFESILNESVFEINLGQFGSNGLYFIRLRDEENKVIHVRNIILH